jgi:hypothetical protein
LKPGGPLGVLRHLIHAQIHTRTYIEGGGIAMEGRTTYPTYTPGGQLIHQPQMGNSGQSIQIYACHISQSPQWTPERRISLELTKKNQARQSR